MNIFKNITLDTIISQGKGNIVSDMNGEIVMMNIDRGKYYNLGDIGGTIWNMIETPQPVNQIVSALKLEYSVETSVCETQVVQFLESLNNEGLIIIENQITNINPRLT